LSKADSSPEIQDWLSRQAHLQRQRAIDLRRTSQVVRGHDVDEEGVENLQPRQHALLLAFQHTFLHHFHELRAKIFCVKASLGVDVKTPHAHIAHALHLPQQLFFVQLVVP
jgi:hypothetical protein